MVVVGMVVVGLVVVGMMVVGMAAAPEVVGAVTVEFAGVVPSEPDSPLPHDVRSATAAMVPSRVRLMCIVPPVLQVPTNPFIHLGPVDG
jgi:hypothetical protein